MDGRPGSGFEALLGCPQVLPVRAGAASRAERSFTLEQMPAVSMAHEQIWDTSADCRERDDVGTDRAQALDDRAVGRVDLGRAPHRAEPGR